MENAVNMFHACPLVFKIAVLITTILLKTSKDRHLQTHPFFNWTVVQSFKWFSL